MGTQALSQIMVLFILMAAGFLCCKLKVVPKEAAQYFSSFGMKVTFPCLIITSFNRPFSSELLGEAGTAIFVAFSVYAFAFLIALLYPHILRMKGPERGVHRYTIIVSNSVFIGFPVVEAVLGTAYLFHVALFNLPLFLVGLTAGLWLIAKENKTSPSSVLSWKLFVTPPVIATVAGFVMFLFSVSLPAPLQQGISLIGGITTPLFMIIIGISMAQADVRRIFGNGKIYVTVFVRLVAVPFLTALFCLLVGIRGNLLILAVLISAMPAASTTTVIASVYGVAVEEAGAIVVLSTLLSLATIPLVMLVLNHV
ncbi:MAG: AEC family transporter [Treponema sp.]|jgi:predicted permease|nr:AEC family transporter [Treponema sp.]